MGRSRSGAGASVDFNDDGLNELELVIFVAPTSRNTVPAEGGVQGGRHWRRHGVIPSRENSHSFAFLWATAT